MKNSRQIIESLIRALDDLLENTEDTCQGLPFWDRAEDAFEEAQMAISDLGTNTEEE